jgi:hypothetical protein
MVLIFTGYQKEMEALFSYDPVAEVLTYLGHMLKMKSRQAGTVSMGEVSSSMCRYGVSLVLG